MLALEHTKLTTSNFTHQALSKNLIKSAFNHKQMIKPLHRVPRVFDFNQYFDKQLDSISHHSYSRQHSNNHNKNPDRILKFDRTFEKYLKEIEDITHRPLHPIQRKEIKYHLDHFEYRRLSTEESHAHRADFNHKKKEIIADWEHMTGEKWPTYDKPIYSKSGKMIRQVGANYDLHHILECSWGGDNEGWNMTPATHPDQHNKQIHGKNSIATKIFG